MKSLFNGLKIETNSRISEPKVLPWKLAWINQCRRVWSMKLNIQIILIINILISELKLLQLQHSRKSSSSVCDSQYRRFGDTFFNLIFLIMQIIFIQNNTHRISWNNNITDGHRHQMFQQREWKSINELETRKFCVSQSYVTLCLMLTSVMSANQLSTGFALRKIGVWGVAQASIQCNKTESSSQSFRISSTYAWHCSRSYFFIRTRWATSEVHETRNSSRNSCVGARRDEYAHTV